MKVKKELIVLTFSELKPSKFGGDYHRVELKSVDKSDRRSYSLNLQKQVKGRNAAELYKNWYKWCFPGNVLEVVMQEKYPLNVDQFMEFKVLKGKERPTQLDTEEIKKESIKEDMFQLQLDQINRKVNKLNNNVDKILEILEK